MSRFIPKKTLTESMASNPLDKAVAEDQDVTALAQEGILTAAAAETDAINQYSQILELVGRSEPWLGEMVKPTLEDIISEEKKHFAQLTTIVSKLPAFKEEFEAGTKEAETGKDETTEIESKEEVEESLDEALSDYYKKDPKTGKLIDPETGTILVTDPVGFFQNDKFNPVFNSDSNNRLKSIEKSQSNKKANEEEVEESVKEKTSEEYNEYNLDTIVRIITEESNVTIQYLYDLTDALNIVDNELYPEQVDQLLAQIDFNPETLDRIEKRIIEEADIEKNKKDSEVNDIKDDIDTLKSLLDPDHNIKLFSQKAIEGLTELIKQLEDDLD